MYLEHVFEDQAFILLVLVMYIALEHSVTSSDIYFHTVYNMFTFSIREIIMISSQ